MRYGMPYMGSKNTIAKEIVDFLPPAECFVDLFCGGCAITHAAMLSGKYKRFIINDVNSQVVQLFVDAVNGKFRDEKRWISREDFFRLKDYDAFVKYVWSFGNGGYSYIYGRKIEAWKKALHYARVLGDFSLLERDFGIVTDDASPQNIRLNAEKWGLNNYSTRSIKCLQSRENLERLQSFERLGRLKNLCAVERLEPFTDDYQAVKIPGNAVVYCDPPYGNCSATVDKRTYCKNFKIHDFIDWLRKVDFPVFVSEYAMPDDFIPVWSKEGKRTYSRINNAKSVIERVFVHERFVDDVRRKIGGQLGLFEKNGEAVAV
jgi:site-specific DNA-adenine methylase|nr:MAG TPA_asm: DNA adenine methylase [Caudoviricetes sp.]